MKKLLLILLPLALCLTACGAESSVSSEPETAPVISSVSKEHCFLCGDGAKDLPYWGQDNVGIISLNTFEIMPIAINRYDDQGALIEKNINRITTHGFQARENGFCAYAFETPDRGRASISLTLNNDSTLDTEKLAIFLCQDCLDAALSGISSPGLGVGVVSFAAKELHILEEPVTGFDFNDHYVNYNQAELSVFYCPLRYSEDT